MALKAIDIFMQNFATFFKNAPVQGHLDDLIGQQILIYFIILFISVLLIILVTVYILNVWLLFNKDKILNKFNNKYVVFYIKYQAFLVKVSLIYLPIFIFMGLFTITHAMFFLITHQIPFEQLNIDLHTYVSFKENE